MDVRQLAALVAIADHGTFSAAARALYTVQSNVSGHIAKLEHELDDITSEIAALHDEVSGEVRLGIIGTTGRWVVPQLLSAMAATVPRVTPVVFEASTSSLVPALLDGRINAALMHLPVDDPELLIEPLFAEDLVMLAPIGHRLSGQPLLDLRDLNEVPLLLPPPGTAFRRILERAAAGAGITLRAQAQIDGVRLMASLAVDGFGAAIVPATAVPRWVSGNFERISVSGLPRRVVAWIQRRRPGANPATQALHATLRAVIEAQAGLHPDVHLGSGPVSLERTG